MKYLYVFLGVLFSAANIRAQVKPFKLEGTSSSFFDGYKAYLYVKTDDHRKVLFLDSTVLKNGEFRFAGQLTQPSSNASIKLILKKEQYYSDFVLDTGLNQMVFKEEHLYKRYFANVNMRSVSNIIKFKVDSIDRKAYADQRAEANIKEEMVSLSISRTHERDLKELKIIETYPDNYYSLISLYFLGKHVSMAEYTDLILQTFDKLSMELKSSDLGRKLYASKSADVYAKKASKEGQPSPIFSVKDNQDRNFTNKSMLGTPYLLVFTATWCVPCQNQLPKLRKIADNYGKRGLKIVYISVDDDLQKWKNHLQTVPSEWTHLSDRQEGQQGKIQKMFYVRYIPTYFLIDAAGKIAYNSDTTDPELLDTEKYIRSAFD
jgi:peroxiredoxin